MLSIVQNVLYMKSYHSHTIPARWIVIISPVCRWVNEAWRCLKKKKEEEEEKAQLTNDWAVKDRAKIWTWAHKFPLGSTHQHSCHSSVCVVTSSLHCRPIGKEKSCFLQTVSCLTLGPQQVPVNVGSLGSCCLQWAGPWEAWWVWVIRLLLPGRMPSRASEVGGGPGGRGAPKELVYWLCWVSLLCFASMCCYGDVSTAFVWLAARLHWLLLGEYEFDLCGL